MAISLVGTAVNSGLNGADLTVTFPGGVQAGDVVYGAYCETDGSDLAMSTVTSGYTELADVTTIGGASPFSNLGVYRKVQGGTPDSSIQFNASGNTSNGVAGAVMIFRGVDTSQQEDATTTTTSGGSSGVPNPISITTVTANAVVIAIGSSSEPDTATGLTSYTDITARAEAGDTNDCSIMMAIRTIASPTAENPGTFTGISGSVSDNYCAATVAIRPAPSLGFMQGYIFD